MTHKITHEEMQESIDALSDLHETIKRKLFNKEPLDLAEQAFQKMFDQLEARNAKFLETQPGAYKSFVERFYDHCEAQGYKIPVRRS